MTTTKASGVARPDLSLQESPLAEALQAAREGRFDEAVTALRGVTSAKPGSPNAWRALAIVLQAEGKPILAHDAVLKMLELLPGSRDGLVLLGRILYDLGKDTQARQVLEPLVRRAPADYEAAQRLLVVVMRIADVPAVLALTERWLPQRPSDSSFIAAHAWALEMMGDLDAAAALYEALIASGERAADAWHRLSRMGRPLDSAAIEILTQNEKLSPHERSVAAFALGEAKKKEKDWDGAFRAFDLGNRLMAVPHDRVQQRKMVEKTLEFADRGLLERLSELGDQDPAPIFIVGMPRSGTSLVEQILGAHPCVQQLGERPEIANLAKDMPKWLGMVWPNGLLGLTKRVLRREARGYKQAVGVDPSALRFTDKAPGNYHFLGLIAALFPKARVVHCRRNPLDSILSNYFTNFGTTRVTASGDLQDLKWNYENYARLMQRWREVLPLPLLEVDYECLVTRGESEIRRLIEFAELPWEDSCARPHESQTRCLTASSHQVSQPIHTGSVATWRRYEKHLEDLLPLLDLWQDPLAPA